MRWLKLDPTPYLLISNKNLFRRLPYLHVLDQSLFYVHDSTSMIFFFFFCGKYYIIIFCIYKTFNTDI